MFEIVIVPLDGSELAEAALPPARELSEKMGSLILLVRAIEPMSHLIATQPPTLLDTPSSAEANVELLEEVVHAERVEATQYLEEVKAGLGLARVETLVVEGQPGDAIVETAAGRGAGLVIMSSHGRGGLGRVIFGSVADHVLRKGKTPVLLIRLEEHS